MLSELLAAGIFVMVEATVAFAEEDNGIRVRDRRESLQDRIRLDGHFVGVALDLDVTVGELRDGVF